MPEPSDPAAAQALWAEILLRAFAAAGVQDVVISPGSRSTPFVLAASRHPQLRCHDIIDERSAAYFALGQARLSGRPSLLLCTSGTAVANYLPAVVEAGMAHVPLLVLSADRPVDLVDCGANQTIDQLKIFGSQARDFIDLGSADTSPRAQRALRRRVAQAVLTASYPAPGAVHLNARAKKPLQPSEPERPLSPKGLLSPNGLLSPDVLSSNQVRPRLPRVLPRREDLQSLARCLAETERGLIVLGPAAVSQAEANAELSDLIERSGCIVFADPASQYRFCRRPETAIDTYDSLLRSAGFRRRWRPQLILQIGRVPTSGVFESYLDELQTASEESPKVEHWVLAAHGWNDPQSTADHMLFGDIEPTLKALNRLLPRSADRDDAWVRAWQEADHLARQVIDAELAGSPAAVEEALSEGQVARWAVAALPSDGMLVLGNSLPIREVDVYCPGGTGSFGKSLAVASQRGTSGIDGVVSGALGAATVHRAPSLLLIGDISFLHDLAGLAAAHWVTTPLVLLVVQNQGGRIFEQLPVSRHLWPATADESSEPDIDTSSMRHWLTPHAVQMAPAAALFGLPFQRVESLRPLVTALEEGLQRPGVSIVEAVVPPHGAAEQNQRLRHEMQRQLTAAGLT